MFSLREIVRCCNIFWAHRKGVNTGKGVYISLQGRLNIASSARVIFGDNVSIFKNYRIEADDGAFISLGNHVHFREGARLHAGKNSKIIIEDGCYFNHDISIIAFEEISIGHNSIFGPLCYIADNNHGVVKGLLIKHQKQQANTLSIGSDVWLGVGATLLKGANVGDGAVIGARAVVTKRVPNNEIWAGVPAKRIGERSEI